MTFNETGILPALIVALTKESITEPTPIQAKAVPVLLAGTSAYLNSETGTGKTLAYLLPLFCRIDTMVEAPQVVVIVPTHELAIQIQRQSGLLAQNAGLPIRSVLLIGGTWMPRQIEKLKKRPQVVIGSPGRIYELIAMGKLKVQHVKSVVIDEADRLLGADSLTTVRSILRAIPGKRQLIFVSATEQPACSSEAGALVPGLLRIHTGIGQVNSNIEHVYLVCDERDKPEVLRKLIHALRPVRALVFVHRNERAEAIAAKLAHHKVAVGDLHGAFDKSERKKAMDDFRSGRITVLIASDLAARGLDIKGITHVFNVDMPAESKAYLHRVGRTARAGAKGQAISLMTDQEVRLAKRYESELGIRMMPIRLFGGKVLAVDDAG